MSNPVPASSVSVDSLPQDPVDSVVPVIHIVIPAFGAAMMFLLAFIAVTMA